MINPITSIKAKCKDCHRCIRSCAVKAIRLRGDQARVVQEQCIVCGACTDACTQRAITVQSQVPRVMDYLASGRTVHISLAPSYVAAFPNLTPGQVVAGLKSLGFGLVEETASAAEHIAAHYRQYVVEGNVGFTRISSCCPVIVNLVEIYYPHLLPMLSDTVSPMVLHGRLLHQRDSQAKVVFIGPCIAKMQEATRSDSSGAVDAVMTFAQLDELWVGRGIDPRQLPPLAPDRATSSARVFPLSRGILASSGLQADQLVDVVTVNGIDNCMETFRDVGLGTIRPRFIEALACRDGCIGGPGICSSEGIAVRRAKVLHYQKAAQDTAPADTIAITPPLISHTSVAQMIKRSYHARASALQMPSQEQIRAILVRIGKHSEADESNCGGCGYATCRDKAIATYHGFAELEMCVPYMKAKFESLSHLVVDCSFNGIVIVNHDLTVHRFNPMAQRLFNPTNEPTRGIPLAAFLDPIHFEQVRATGELQRARVAYPELGLVTHQTIYSLPGYGLLVGVIADVTEDEQQKQTLEKKHQATIERASLVIKNQMKLAQEIAGLLGEATSETKATLLDLIATLADDKGNFV